MVRLGYEERGDCYFIYIGLWHCGTAYSCGGLLVKIVVHKLLLYAYFLCTSQTKLKRPLHNTSLKRSTFSILQALFLSQSILGFNPQCVDSAH
jgi:hypothetical protein